MPSRNKIEVLTTFATEGAQSTIDKLGDIGDLIQGVIAVWDKVTQFTRSVDEMVRTAAKTEQVKAAFDGIAASSGHMGDAVLRAMQKASSGMIDNATLMKSYNQAAQLVSTTFANQLPDAMQYLTKVAASTGQDMGYMLDSIVVGVGRLSPKILDNLGIQVDLTAATEAYAKSVGKSADALTKSEQQTAVMNAVLEQLKTNTAAMPDVTDTAATKFAQFDTKMANLKDTIGGFLIPVFMKLMDVVQFVVDALTLFVTGDFVGGMLGGAAEDSPLVNFILTLRENFLKVVGVARQVGDTFSALFTQLGGGNIPIGQTLWNFFDRLAGIADSLGATGLGDILRGVGDAIKRIADAISPTIAAGVQKIGEVFQVAGDVISNAWKNFVQPALKSLSDWFLNTALPAIINFIQSQVITALQNFFGFIGRVWDQVRPALENLASWFLNTALPAIITVVKDFWNNILVPFINFLKSVWELISPALSDVFNWFVNTGIPIIRGVLEGFWNNVLTPVINFIVGVWDKVSPALGSLLNWFASVGLPIIKELLESFWHYTLEPVVQFFVDLWNKIQPGLSDLKTGIETIFNWINDNIFKPVGKWITDNIITPISELLGKIDPSLQNVRNLFETIFNAIKGFIQPVVDLITGIPKAVDTAVSNLSRLTSGAEAARKALSEHGPGEDITAILNAIGSEITHQPMPGGAQGLVAFGPSVVQIGEDLQPGEIEAVLNQRQLDSLVGGGKGLTVNFYGDGGPTTQHDANDRAMKIVNGLRSQGVRL